MPQSIPTAVLNVGFLAFSMCIAKDAESYFAQVVQAMYTVVKNADAHHTLLLVRTAVLNFAPLHQMQKQEGSALSVVIVPIKEKHP